MKNILLFATVILIGVIAGNIISDLMIMHNRAAVREIERQAKAREFCAQYGLDSEIDAVTCGKIWTATGAK